MRTLGSRAHDSTFALGTVWAVPLCDARDTERVRGIGLALLVLRTEPFTLRDGRALVFGFPEVPNTNLIDESWFHQAPSIATIVFAKSIREANWNRVATADVSKIHIPQFKTCDDHNRWRHTTFDPASVNLSGREWIITEAEAGDRAYGVGDALLFQCRLYCATRLGWKWAPPMNVLTNGFKAIEHLL